MVEVELTRARAVRRRERAVLLDTLALPKVSRVVVVMGDDRIDGAAGPLLDLALNGQGSERAARSQ
eukprot:scaffold17871_cov82-Phaeocystis_antarctica.AAC.3